MVRRTAKAEWQGSGLEGSGKLTGPSGVLNGTPYSSKMRFQNEDGRAGTNPEELIAAAHAGCFSMALSFQLAKAGHVAERITTDAVIFMDQVAGNYEIQRIQLKLEAQVPGIAASEFQRLANDAKEGCPVSKALQHVPIELEARLL